MRRALIPICCIALLAAGCGGGGPPVTDSERRVGAEQHPQLLSQFGGAYEERQAAYVASLGEKLAANAGLERQCTFTLVNTDVVNAFAVPGCYIYITRGLLGIVNSEAELASVLAHELGHIAANHSERQQRRSIIRSLGVLAVSMLSGSERLSQIAGAAAGLFTLRYSRSHEYEADDLGLTYLRRAGYDPYAAADMLNALGRHQAFLSSTRGRDSAKGIPEWALTHPLTENRVARAGEAAAATGLADDELPEREAEYLRAVDGLLYGDDPAQGFVTGRRFAHPIMRIGFEAPSGFTLTNSPQAILLEGPDGVRGEFAGGRMPAAGLQGYARALLANLLRDAPVEVAPARPFSANGVPALLVPASVRTREGEVPVTLAAYDAGGGAVYHFVLVGPAAGAAQALFESFRLLTAAEAAGLRPRRIRVVAPAPGETVATLARRMAAEQPLDHLLMLNGRRRGEPLRPGQPLKLVVTAAR
ncbi:MAG TPA: M48 family metalloprotease [Sphingomicrobium sp.]|nr:M48 family metalloprotease [Sphingomicrobium sp.]